MIRTSCQSKFRAPQHTEFSDQEDAASHVKTVASFALSSSSSSSSSTLRPSCIRSTSSSLLLIVKILILLEHVTPFSIPLNNHQQQHPENVVRDQLQAFQDSNIQAAFQFASPENQVVTGPWQNFAQLMYSEPAFQPIVGHEKATVLMTVSTEDWGMCCLVRIVPQSNKLHSKKVSCLEYWWELTKQQDGKYKGCWMVDSVLPDFEDMSLTLDDMMEEEDDPDGDVYFDLLDLLE